MQRLAIYYAPRPGAFADRAAQWLGRDAETGGPVPQPGLAEPTPEPVPDLAALTAEPRRYGFHGTIRAPFRPRADLAMAAIEQAVADLAVRLAPVRCEGLRIENLHGFLALTPEGDTGPLARLAARVVEATDGLRAPLTDADIARRRPERLTARQRDLLALWGYPYVMEEFRFHLTLTGPLTDETARHVGPLAARHFGPVLPRPFPVEDLCLFAEQSDGTFRLCHRYALCG